MSQQNVEIVSRLLGPWDGADVVSVARDDATWTRWSAEVGALFKPDYTVTWIAHGQRPIEATGLDDARQGWLDWLEPWETYHPEIERIVPVGDRVVALLRLHGRMAASESEVEMISASVYLIQDGRVARIDHYANRAEALEAVGLRE